MRIDEGNIKKFKELIKNERANNPDIYTVSEKDARLLATILGNFNLKEPQESDEMAEAELIFLGGPTGAGKDTLVKRIENNHPEKNYITLNIDKFRQYYDEITGNLERIKDADYALTTNHVAYEIYYLIQEFILQNYPGTNIIITGTLHDKQWITEISERYKKDRKTKYQMTLTTLAVPVSESAFSIIERYLRRVDDNRIHDRNNVPCRYTDIKYHDETVKNFENNLRYYEAESEYYPTNATFKRIRVYRRSKDLFDLAEDTLVYDSKSENNRYDSAGDTVHTIMNSKEEISLDRVAYLLSLLENNAQYLKEQNLYSRILDDLAVFVPGFRLNNKGKTDNEGFLPPISESEDELRI